MKKAFTLFFISAIFIQFNSSCKKETIVEKIVYEDTSSNRLYLFEFLTIPQTASTARVAFTFKDLDEDVNTSYDNTLFNVNTATIHEQNTLTVSKAVYDNVNYTDYYRSTTISRPNNDTIKIIFRIGTQGDVDIKVE